MGDPFSLAGEVFLLCDGGEVFVSCGAIHRIEPVRVALVRRPEEYRWSSAAAHIAGRDDLLVRIAPLQQLARNWGSFLSETVHEDEIMLAKKHECTGRILGSQTLIVGFEKSLGRTLRKQPPGPKKVK